MRRTIPSVQSSHSISVSISQMTYICTSCRHQALRQRISQLQPIRNASSGLPQTERLRRRIWGSDNPPGLRDPYGAPGFFERRRKQAQKERGERPPEPESTILRPEAAPSEPANLEPRSAPIDRHEHAMRDIRWSRTVPGNDPEIHDPKYRPAETWDGLERVGLSGHWKEERPKPEESFRP